MNKYFQKFLSINKDLLSHIKMKFYLTMLRITLPVYVLKAKPLYKKDFRHIKS